MEGIENPTNNQEAGKEKEELINFMSEGVQSVSTRLIEGLEKAKEQGFSGEELDEIKRKVLYSYIDRGDKDQTKDAVDILLNK